jgi:hypothetical protein
MQKEGQKLKGHYPSKDQNNLFKERIKSGETDHLPNPELISNKEYTPSIALSGQGAVAHLRTYVPRAHPSARLRPKQRYSRT